jgi:hypothetical protein
MFGTTSYWCRATGLVTSAFLIACLARPLRGAMDETSRVQGFSALATSANEKPGNEALHPGQAIRHTNVTSYRF